MTSAPLPSPNPTQTSFTLQLKLLGQQIQAQVLFSDNRHTLIDRLCNLYDIPGQYREAMFEKITTSLNNIIKKDNVSPSLLDKILGFFHKGPVCYDGREVPEEEEEIEEMQDKGAETVRVRQEKNSRTGGKSTKTKEISLGSRNVQSKILRQSTNYATNRPRIAPTIFGHKRTLTSTQKPQPPSTARHYRNPRNSHNPQSHYLPNPLNPNIPNHDRFSRTARILPHHSRPQPCSKLKLFSRPQQQPASNKSASNLHSHKSKHTRSSSTMLRRYKYLADNEYSYYL